nr:low molecular weight protein-tyrosine-phosphatase [uncultured Albidiferax sp.]
MRSILIVCTANICRSPMAQVIAAQAVQQMGLANSMRVDSAGTHAAKGTLQPDSRARKALEKRGYAVKKGSSSQVEAGDFERFDLILAMDRTNLKTLQALCPAEYQSKLRLFLEMAKGCDTDEVPDPYYGNAEGFDRVLDLCEAGVDGWLAHLC